MIDFQCHGPIHDRQAKFHTNHLRTVRRVEATTGDRVGRTPVRPRSWRRRKSAIELHSEAALDTDAPFARTLVLDGHDSENGISVGSGINVLLVRQICTKG